MFQYLPFVIRMVGVMSGDDNCTGLAGLRQFDQQPENIIYLVPMVISMLRVGWKENLDAVTSALQPFPELAAQAQRILDMPASQVDANLAEQPAAIRERTQRLIDAVIEGKFETGNATGEQK